MSRIMAEWIVGHGEAGAVLVLLRQTLASSEPCEAMLYDTSLGQRLEADRLIESFDDLEVP